MLFDSSLYSFGDLPNDSFHQVKTTGEAGGLIRPCKGLSPASANRALKIWQSHLYYRLRQTDIDQISAFVKSRFSNARYSIRHDGFRVSSRVLFQASVLNLKIAHSRFSFFFIT